MQLTGLMATTGARHWMAGIPTQRGDYLDPEEGRASVSVSGKMPCQLRQSLELDEELAEVWKIYEFGDCL